MDIEQRISRNKEIKEYNIEYQKKYSEIKKNRHKRRTSKELELKMTPRQEYYFIPEINEERIEIEVVNCSYFGCGKKLSREEKLYGDRCINHPKKILKPF